MKRVEDESRPEDRPPWEGHPPTCPMSDPEAWKPGKYLACNCSAGDFDDRVRVEPSTAMVKWADSAQFEAAPLDPGIRVDLLWMTPDPLGAIAAACMMYEGKPVHSLDEVTDEQRLHYFEQVMKTHLKAPLEFVQFHFLVSGVTRSFTHQMVRQRTATFAQESLRFAVKGNLVDEMSLPPALEGLAADNPLVVVWRTALVAVENAYLALVDGGVPAEEARELLPHGTTTRLHYTTDLRALLEHAGNRLCTQAQFHWRVVLTKIVEAIRKTNVHRVGGKDPFFDSASLSHAVDGRTSVWMADVLADVFRPICYLTGKCEFKASFDRACKIRERVDANEGIGRPSSEWEEDFQDEARKEWSGPTDGSLGYDKEGRVVFIGAIHPAEWLLDPAAAR